MKRSLLSLLVCLAGLVLVPHARPDDAVSVGATSEPGTIEPYTSDECYYGLVYNHDMTFENGYAWQYSGIMEPYYGAFGEGFTPQRSTGRPGTQGVPQNVSPEEVECAVFWLTDLYYYAGQTCDVYVWEGGVTIEPGAVLMMVPGIDPGPPAVWPAISEHRVYVGCPHWGISEFTVGYWGNWPGMHTAWYVAADLDGWSGSPWTCLAPGSGYGTGWVDPSIVWGPTMSLGIGYTGDYWVETKSATWGEIKALFE